MTDNEIIKALEICIDFVSGGEVMCNNCPLYDCENCSSEKLKQALDLINRQKAEIEKKNTEIDILIEKKDTLQDENSNLMAEVERLKSDNDILSKNMHNLCKELECEKTKNF